MLRPVHPEVFAADRLIAALPLPAAEPAALVAEKFHLVLLRRAQPAQPVKRLIEPKIRHNIRKRIPRQFAPEVFEFRQHFRGGRNEIELRIGLLQVLEQHIRMDDHAVSRLPVR